MTPSRRLVLAVALVASVSAEAQVVTLLGAEFRVNTYTTQKQNVPRVGRASNGDFVVVWESFKQFGTNASSYEIFGQRYASSGAPKGGEFLVNTYTTGVQRDPSLAVLPNGDFIVVWGGIGAANASGIFFQRYSSTGAPVGSDFRFSVHSLNNQGNPSLAADSAGNFVVSWSDGYESFRPHAQRFSSSGAPLGAEFTVALTVVSPNQYFGRSTVGMSPTGDFVVVWDSGDPSNTNASNDVFLRRFTSAGTALSGDTQINTYTSGKQQLARVAMDGAGNFVVVWRDGDSASYITARRFSSAGNPLTGEFRVNTIPGTYVREEPSVASDPAGNFIVAWDGQGYGGMTIFDALARIYKADGSPVGSDFRLNTNTGNGDFKPWVALDSSGGLVAVWENNSLDGFLAGVYAQRYCSNLVVVTPPASVTVTQTLCQ